MIKLEHNKHLQDASRRNWNNDHTEGEGLVKIRICKMSSETHRWVLGTTTSLCIKKNGQKLPEYSQHVMEKIRYLKIPGTAAAPCAGTAAAPPLHLKHTLFWDPIGSKKENLNLEKNIPPNTVYKCI